MCDALTYAMLAMSAVSLVSQQKAMKAQQKQAQAERDMIQVDREMAQAQAIKEKGRIKRAAALEQKRNMVIGSWYGWNVGSSPSLAATNIGIESALQRESYDIDYLASQRDAKYALQQRYSLFGSNAAWQSGIAGMANTLFKAGATFYQLQGPADLSSGRAQTNTTQSGGGYGTSPTGYGGQAGAPGTQSGSAAVSGY